MVGSAARVARAAAPDHSRRRETDDSAPGAAAPACRRAVLPCSLDRLERVVRAGRMKAATRAQQRAHGELVAPNQHSDQRPHVLATFCQTARARLAAARSRHSPRSGAHRSPYRAPAARLMQLESSRESPAAHRLRSTARRTTRAAIDMPRRGAHQPIGLHTAVKSSLPSRCPHRIGALELATDAASAALAAASGSLQRGERAEAANQHRGPL